jgi:hypothetical protein
MYRAEYSYASLFLRAVTTTTAAIVLGIERKVLDNLLVRLAPEALPKGRQGVERRIPISLLEHLALTTELSEMLGVPVREAFTLSRALTGEIPLAPRNETSRAGQAPGGAMGASRAGRAVLGDYLRIDADLERLREDLDVRLALAIESVVRRPRGRPRRG